MTYDEAIKYIHSVSNFFCKPGLDRIKALCEGLKNPQNDLKFIHVAGTNGKGSFCAMTDSILRAEGYKVGLYTSPYVLQFNERMKINGENIPDSTLARITEKVKLVAEKMEDSPTEFELITAIAFEYFSEEKCDVVILETGMGGRLDATNLIISPMLSVITGIAIDHIAFLGNTVEKIAEEKAGIIKKSAPVLYGGESKTAEVVIIRNAEEKQSTLYRTDYSRLKILNSDLGGTLFDYKDRRGLKISLLGSYQPRNAAVVLDALDILKDSGLPVSEDSVRKGLLNAGWPARFEIIHQNPTVIFDGAHNAQGISAAVESAKGYFGKNKVVVMTGVLKDKDYRYIAAKLSEIADKAFTVTPDNPRALCADDYAAELSSFGVDATPNKNVKEAIERAYGYAVQNKKPLVFLGSLYTYSEVIDIIEAL